MAKTSSRMLPLGTMLPRFELPDPSGKLWTPAKDAQAYLVMFICNHCPYVKHIREGISGFARDYTGREVAIYGINSNDAAAYPDDSPARMAEESKAAGYIFPYLVDASQSVAKAFEAACTPEFYLFDKTQKLVYRGQFDDSRPGNGLPVTGEDLRRALDMLLKGQSPRPDQTPSIGCNIKWRPGNEPTYFP